MTGTGESMGKDYQEIDERILGWIERQRMFFVATAPRGDDGLVNCSPKGLDALRVTGPRELVYMDTGGSGIETVAHLRENGRVVIMLCAFDGPPKIFRFYGTGRSVEPADAEFKDLAELFAGAPPIRNFIVVNVDRIRDSCGYGVPMYDYKGQRESMQNWLDKRSFEELLQHRRDNNETSLDGLPGLDLDKLPQAD